MGTLFSTSQEPHGLRPATCRQAEIPRDTTPPALAPRDRALLGLGPACASPSGNDHEEGRDRRPQDIRALLGLGPNKEVPGSLTGAALEAGKAGKPVKPKAKRTPGRPAGQRARKPRTLPEPSGDPKGHIQRWLVRGVTGESTDQDGTPESPGGPQDQSPRNCRPMTGCGTEPQPGSWRLPRAPGSSTDPPPPAASSRVRAGSRTPTQVVGAWAMGARRQPGALASTGTGAAVSPKRAGHRFPPGRPAPVLWQTPSVRMKTLPRG